jgi:hypothetical protein
MILKIELPDQLVEELHRGSRAQHLTPNQYAPEMLYQLLAERSLGKDATLKGRADWRNALERSKSDRQVVDWHTSRRE